MARLTLFPNKEKRKRNYRWYSTV